MSKHTKNTNKFNDLYASFSTTVGLMYGFFDSPESQLPIMHMEKTEETYSIDAYTLTIHRSEDADPERRKASPVLTLTITKLVEKDKDGKEVTNYVTALESYFFGAPAFQLTGSCTESEFASVVDAYKKQEAKGNKGAKDPIAKRKRDEARDKRIAKIIEDIQV